MDFTEPDNFFRMGTPPVMVEIWEEVLLPLWCAAA
jgi:hypothetical protein